MPTTNAVTTLSGNGSNDTFAIGYGYLAEGHVGVVVDSVPQTQGASADYLFDELGTSIVFNSGSIPASGIDNVVITRTTPHPALHVTFVDGAPATAADWQNSLLQAIYYTEEVEDSI